MKKLLSMIIALMVLLSGFCFAAEEPAESGDIYIMLTQPKNTLLFVNGIPVNFDEQNENVVPEEDENGNFFVPVRAVVGSAGGWTGWDAETGEVTVIYNGITMSFVPGENIVKVGEEAIELSANTYAKNDRTLVPLDFFVNCMKGNTQIDEEMKTIILAFETKVYAAG